MKKTTLIKKHSFLIALFCAINFGFGQTCIISEDFNRADNTLIGGSWTEVGGDASIFSNILRLETGGAIGRDYIHQNVSGAYNTQLNLLSTSISWIFNMRLGRPDPGGFDSNEYGIAFVLGGTSSDFTTGNGYAVVLGENGTIDNVRLVHYTGGIDLNSNLTDIIRGSFDYNNLEHSSIKVTYVPSTNTWELFVRIDGASFADPLTLTLGDSQGTAINTTYTGLNLPFIGAFYNHDIAANDRATFDNILIGPMTTWASGSWDNGTPTISTHAVIDDYFDTSVNDGIQTSFSACSLTINAGFDLTVANGDYVEVENDVVANGGVIVNSQANFIQNNDSATFTDNTGGLVVVSKEKIMQKWYTYTYWSSPTQTETIEGALGNTPANRRFRFEAANYIDLLAEIGNTNTYISGQDGLDDNGNDWQPASGAMIPGVGYAATASEFGPAFPRPEVFNFYGAFNNGEVLVPLVSNSGGVYEDWNLVGNPYPSAISADQFFAVNTGLVDMIYLWDQGTPPSSTNSGNQNSNFSSDDYAIINGVGEIGARADTGIPPNRFVPSGQGFFVIAAAAGNLTFNNSMRAITHDNSQFFKSTKSKSKSSNNSINKIWINLTSDNGIYNQIMVGYTDGATNANDGAFYDATRDLASLNNTSLYSVIENDNGKFAIQAKDANNLNENETIKLGFKSAISVATLFKVSVAQLEGDFLNSNTIYLKDNLLNKTHNLSASDYTFTSAVGEFNNRFEIVFSNQALTVEDVLLNKNTLKIIELNNDYVQFNTSDNLNIKSVKIFDLLGRQLYQFKGETTSETYKLSNLNNSIYIAKVTLSNGAVITKKAFKK